MGKLGRIVCITTPMVLTIAAFLTQVVINVAGWDKNSDALNSLYFFQADFSQLDITAANDISQGLELAGALQIARSTGLLAATYNIHLWNYCSSDSTLANGTEGEVDFCSDRQAKFWFNPVEVWGLDNSESRSQLVEATGEDRNLIEQTLDNLQGNVGDLANMVLDESSQDALNTYQTVSKWMFIAYQASLWVTLATIVAGVLAIFSRWGSLLTWILSLASSVLSFAASLTATILFSVLTGALTGLLDPYNVQINLGTRLLAVTWLSTVFSLGATLFWLFSVCCCSGRSNPHHKSQRGGLWRAAPKGENHGGRSRSLKTEKTGYERVGSPSGDRVPLAQYPQQQTGYAPYHQPGNAYQPVRQG